MIFFLLYVFYVFYVFFVVLLFWVLTVNYQPLSSSTRQAPYKTTSTLSHDVSSRYNASSCSRLCASNV